MTRTAAPLAWFIAWLAVGAGLALGLLSLMTIGVFVLAITAGAAVFLATRRHSSDGLPGLISGLSLPLFYVAYLNRSGPGTVCERLAGGGWHCTDAWRPWPWAAVGGLLLLAGVAVFVLVRRAIERDEDGWAPSGTERSSRQRGARRPCVGAADLHQIEQDAPRGGNP